MSIPRPLISFDWAIKRLLRQKANYGILEGFLSELLKQDIVISTIKESQSNKENVEDKFNQVDILCENEQKELFLIELQYNSERDYFHRMAYGTSKIITEYMGEGFKYELLKKVYSINIVYFELGQGADYVYYGKNEFRGIHHHDILQVNESQRAFYTIENVYQIFPEYYIIKVNTFNDIAKDTLDEWIYYLKNNAVPEGYRAKGLDMVESKLKLDSMTPEERMIYEAHLKSNAISHNEIETAKMEGREEGREEGRVEGREEGREEERIRQQKIQDDKHRMILKNMISKGFSKKEISETIEISFDEIERLIGNTE
ncbi:MAG: hypothetical protein RLZZ546_2933 [Bacteroidota bacterium]|jgi:predicted transposase/invertase (TIGR01784 family)